ncbi:MAG: hypothetical protein EA400_10900 [Chromatiaceae bacterium]|nr:MAG: hypothetical protein EA400_10900 [Chromatiaceae bacterium]
MPTISETIGHCWHCGAALGSADYGRETSCLACGRPTRCCRNCRHYARGRPNDCVEPLAEPVADKARANFCEHFDPIPDPGTPAAGTGTQTADLRAAAEDLFK